MSVKTLALRLPKQGLAHHHLARGFGREAHVTLCPRAVRTAPSKGARELGAAGHPEETLLIEWPPGEAAPTKYWLSNLPAKTKFRDLVDMYTLTY